MRVSFSIHFPFDNKQRKDEKRSRHGARIVSRWVPKVANNGPGRSPNVNLIKHLSSLGPPRNLEFCH